MKKLLLASLVLLSACSSKGGGSSASSNDGVTVVTVGSGASTASVQLTWTASTGAPNGYYVEKGTDGVNFSVVKTVVGGSTTTARIDNLATGGTYYFRVRAYNGGGYSAASTIIPVTP